MSPVYINTLSIAAPAMVGLDEAMPFLTGKLKWQSEAFPKLSPQLLPANERRRTTPYIKLALQVADEAKLKDKQLAAVFASSCGDFQISNTICDTLTMEPKFISPTQFHNSVHNAPSGYWAIAAKSPAASTSISSGDATYASGLLEAVTQVLSTTEDVLFVAYDYPATEPLSKVTDVTEPFATACVLSLNKTASSYASIILAIKHDDIANSDCANSSLNTLQKSNPIAACLPLLEAVCSNNSATLYLPYLNDSKLEVEVTHD